MKRPVRASGSFTIGLTLAAVLAVCLVVQLAWPLANLTQHISWDYGEGWNAYWAARAMAGAPLYTPPDSLITDNYPPLSFYLFGVVGRLYGDYIIGGRLLSLASLGTCGAGVVLLVVRMGGGARWAWASGAGFLLYVACFAWRYVGSDDPQWLAAVFTLATLLVLTIDRLPSGAALAGAAALLIVGGLIKHNQVAAPIAISLWFAWVDRRRLAWWLVVGVLLLGSTLAGLHDLYGPLLFDQVLHHHRILKLGYFANAMGTLSGLLPEFFLGGLLWSRNGGTQGDPRDRLILLFAVVATVIGIVERFGTGVSANAHFDGMIGLAVVAGVALGRPGMLDPKRRWRMAGFCLAPLVLATIGMLPHTVRRIASLDADRADWAASIERVRTTTGPVACELPAMCYWAGKPFLIDFYNYGQKLRTTGDPADLRDAIAERRFALMVVVRDRRTRIGDGRLPPAYDRLVDQDYRPFLALPDDALLLLPRRRPW